MMATIPIDNTEQYIVYYGESNEYKIHNKKFPNNKTTTTKYTIINFIPKSLLMQFRKVANIYFLVITVLTFCSFSPINPASMVGTFIFVLTCTMIKEAFEDYRRYQQDEINNNRLVLKYIKDGWKETKCWTLMPGDIIKVLKNEELSSDVLLLKTSNENGYAYIETKSLDGETNLKEKVALQEFKNIYEEDYNDLRGSIICDFPNENLNVWNGKIKEEDNKDIDCEINNMILKGCVLKNTDYICGIIIYSGKNTKIMKNAKNVKGKSSKVLNIMNKLLYSVFIFEISLCIIFGYLSLESEENKTDKYTYIFISSIKTNRYIKFLTNTMTYFVLYSNMIPISLYVVLEIIKSIQGVLINYDKELHDPTIDKYANCRTTELIEELGQVEFIFSDKTGTLTQNSMILKKVYINGKVYGNKFDDAPDAKFSINGDLSLVKKLRMNSSEGKKDKRKIEDFLYILAVCHDIFPEEKNGEIIYQGSSPDEVSLVKGAANLGFVYKSKNNGELTIENEIEGTTMKYEVKLILPFDSFRKRMSVIVYNKEQKIYELFTKGADTVMLNLIKFKSNEKEEVKRINSILSHEGLRILMVGKKQLKEENVKNYLKKIKGMKKEKDQKLLYKIYNSIEKDLKFCGTAAVEDKLQEGVPGTIGTLLACNIRVWVLTGDKIDTAIEIAKSCNLINDNMFLIFLTDDGELVENKLKRLKNEYKITDNKENKNINLDEIGQKIRRKQGGKDLSIIVDGVTLEEILVNDNLSLLFFNLAVAAKSVLCCRMNPSQKSKIVKLVKTHGKWVTLAIGDGVNDVPMIMEAHIGVGIQGKEGTQAVRTADFSIGQFRFLDKLLLIYGRVGYIKISKFICYYFYKNILLVFNDIIFAFINGFSGQLYFADYLTTMYNAIFTSWCCIFVFSFEKDVDLNLVKKFPILYEAGQKNYFFNITYFWKYIIYAIIHGVFCFFFSQYLFLNVADNQGTIFNHWQKSTINFSFIIHVVSYKLLIISDFWNIINLTASVFSLLLYYMIVFALSSNYFAFRLQNELAGVMSELFMSFKFWIVIIFGPLIVLAIDITMKQISYNTFPNPTEYIKQQLNNQIIKSFLFNEDEVHKYCQSKRAKEAEIKIKEILKNHREKARIKRTRIINSIED